MSHLIQPPNIPSTSTCPSSSYRYDPLASSQNIEIRIPIQVQCHNDEFNETGNILIDYRDETTIYDVIQPLLEHLNATYSPVRFGVTSFTGKGFVSMVNKPHSTKKKITNYNRNNLIEYGIKIQLFVEKFEHKINGKPITCKYMKKHHEEYQQYIPEQCPIYNKMKNNYIYDQTKLLHLKTFTHFMDEDNEKPCCFFGDKCFSFQRLAQNNVKINDLCHGELYRHPPNGDIIDLGSNIKPLKINTKNTENYPLYQPTNHDKKQYKYDQINGFLSALIDEVKDNGFEQCLYLNDDDEALESDEYPLLFVVDNKLHSERHRKMAAPLNRAQMLALILYTGTICNYSLCKSQRKGNYKKWKWFDFCLNNAIELLSIAESGEYILYSGLSKVKLDKKLIVTAYFATYTSSSWKKTVALEFVSDEQGGMILVMDSETRKKFSCCDVSWISKYPDECEILISRSINGNNQFSLKIMDQKCYYQSIQIVSLCWNK